MGRKSEIHWDAKRISALRKFLGMTQQGLAEELGIRQQTVSEWETGVYKPRGGSLRLLDLLASREGFVTGGRKEAEPKRVKKPQKRPEPTRAEKPKPGDWAPWAG